MLQTFLASLKQTELRTHQLVAAIDPITRGWAVIFLGTVTRMGLSFLSGVLIVRAFGPADFGVYSLLTAITGMVGVVVDFGLTEATLKGIAAAWGSERAQALKLAQVFFWARLGLAVGGLVLGGLLAWPISVYLLQLPTGTWLFSLALLGVVTTALNGSVNAVLQATGHFGRISVVLIASSALALLLTILLVVSDTLSVATALLGLGAGTALAGFLVGRRYLPTDWSNDLKLPPLTPPAGGTLPALPSLGGVGGGRNLQQETIANLRPLPDLGGQRTSPLRFPGWAVIAAEGPALFRFGRWLWLANIFKTLIAYLDFFLLNLWLTPAAVGLYALALGLASRVEVVNHSLYTVLIPMAAALKDRQTLLAYLWQGLKRSTWISLALLPLLPLARWFIPLFYGSEFASAGLFFQLLLGVVIFDIITLPVLLLIYTFDRPDLSALAEGTRVVTLVLIAMWLIPSLGPVGAIIAKFCAKVVGVLLTVGLLLRHTRQASLAGDES